MHGQRGKEHYNWRGGRPFHNGYRIVHQPGHVFADHHGYVREHRLVAEDALGRPVPKRHPVHHVNGDTSDNRPGNLILCQNHRYHMLLHRRTKALRESGHVDWVRCRHCKEWSTPNEMYVHPRGYFAHHRSCQNSYQNVRYRERITKRRTAKLTSERRSAIARNAARVRWSKEKA